MRGLLGGSWLLAQPRYVVIPGYFRECTLTDLTSQPPGFGNLDIASSTVMQCYGRILFVPNFHNGSSEEAVEVKLGRRRNWAGHLGFYAARSRVRDFYPLLSYPSFWPDAHPIFCI